MFASNRVATFCAAAAAAGFCSAHSLSVCCRRSYATLAARRLKKGKSPTQFAMCAQFAVDAGRVRLASPRSCVRACVCVSACWFEYCE